MNPNFDWNQLEPENESIEQSQPIPQNQNSFDWQSQPEFQQEKQEKSFIEEIPRHVSRVASRIVETIGGIPGDVSSLINSGFLYGLEKITGSETPEDLKEILQRTKFPTSSELKKFSQESTKGFTEPQNELEKKGDEIAETLSSLLGPMKFRRALGISVGAQAVKEGLKGLGVGEGKQEAGKLGTMFLLSMVNPNGAMKYASSMYDKADSLIKGASIAAPQFEKNLINLQESLKKGVSTPAKNVVLKPTEELIGKIKNGKIPVQDLTAAKRDINTLMGDPALLKREKNLLKNLGSHIDNAIKPFEKINPEFSKAYRPANEIYGTIMQGNKASNFVKKTLGNKSMLGAIMAEAAFGHPEYIMPTVAGIAGAKGIAKGSDFVTRMSKSPELRAFYTKAMIAAAKEDATALRIYEDKIKDYLEKD